jgi:cytoskeletal protein RodZ
MNHTIKGILIVAAITSMLVLGATSMVPMMQNASARSTNTNSNTNTADSSSSSDATADNTNNINNTATASQAQSQSGHAAQQGKELAGQITSLLGSGRCTPEERDAGIC